jgi:ribosome-associated translation inhibitor RaiA
MKIQINTDNHIDGRVELAEEAEATVENTLGHLAEHITRVEVHLSDENSDEDAINNMRCMMEARLEGQQPIAVSDEAGSISQALEGAAEKLKRSLDHTLGRLKDH